MVSATAKRRPVRAPAPHGARMHPVLLRPFVPAGAGATPPTMLVARDDQAFVDGLLEDLVRPDWRSRVGARVVSRRDAEGMLMLQQPVHRVFNLVVLEAVCDQPGQPRLDPAAIESCALVLRRAGERGGWEGWLRQGARRRGWAAIGAAQDADPDASRRAAAHSAGHAEIDRRLALLRAGEALAEHTAPLFLAPPEVCERAGRTVLYGLVPLGAGELSEAASPAPDYAGQDAEQLQALRAHMPRYARAGGAFVPPRAGQRLAADWARPEALAVESALDAFVKALQQLAIEFDAFGESPAARALRAELDRIELPIEEVLPPLVPQARVTRSMPAGTFLAAAARVLVAREANAEGVAMPLRWPAIDAVTGERVFAAALAALDARFAEVKSRRGRFDGPDRRYAVRGFVRLRVPDGCPPRLVWSPYSEPFGVLPWYEPGDAPPVQVPMPDPSDRAALARLRPNVAFQLPPALASLLQRNAPDALIKGEGSASGGNLGWICGFNIPTITLCAFIVLNVFLQLFDLIFRWLAFVKICIPFPKKGGD